MESNETTLNKFEVISKLGEGSFSCVYKVQRIDDRKMYAMKKVKIGQMKEKEKQNALNQVRILASISHPNIVNYRQAFFDDKTQTLCIVMELADAGDIQKKINTHLSSKTHFNQIEIWQALIQMAKGLKALHDINILHRDLKCANVFCTSDGKFKLGDLNVSKVAKRGMARTQTGTPYYTSPEVWNDKPYDSKCDIWSLGCVVYEMASLHPPFRASNLKELYAKIQRGLYESIPRFYSDDLKNIISLCLKVAASQRLSANELLTHPIILRNTPSSQVYSQTNNQTSKCNLLKTIMVPKNLKSLKEALPGSKYDQPIKQDLEKKFKRANSANNLRQQIPRVISTPKGDLPLPKKEELKYAFIRRPSSSNSRKDIHSQRQQDSSKMIGLREQRMERNNSMDSIRKRQSSQSIEPNKRRENSREREEKYMGEDITNRCKQIEERVKNLMQRKKDLKEQRNPNLPSLVRPIEKIQLRYINYLRPSSREKEERPISRNKSIEFQKNDSINSERSRKVVEKSFQRQRSLSRQEKQRAGSIERKIGIERRDSRDSKEFDSKKRYAYGIPPKIKNGY